MGERSEAFKIMLIETAASLRGVERRLFMARTVRSLGEGGQRRAETELRWNRVTIRKGTAELTRGIAGGDAFSGRGRFRAEDHLPNLLSDIKDLVTGQSQADAEKRVKDIYTRMQTKLRDAEVTAREAADKSRKASAYAALWLFVSLLIGAFVASLAATFGGRRRDI